MDYRILIYAYQNIMAQINMPRDQFLMKNLFGLSDNGWSEIFIVITLITCFFIGIKWMNKKYVYKVSVIIGYIVGLFNFIFIWSRADVVMGMAVVAIAIFPFFCYLSARIGYELKIYIINKRKEVR